MALRHFYHLHCDGAWEDIAQAHAEALQDSGGDWDVTCGLTGPAEGRGKAAYLLSAHLPGITFVEADEGWEHLTLSALRGWARKATPSAPVLYAHAKGVRDNSLFNRAWRESMTADVVSNWRGCVRMLANTGIDAVGPHWLDPANLPNMRYAPQENGGSQTPYFGGNFWWARAGYAARLPEPSGTRWDAERWIGLNRPVVHDLRPGWPSYMIFTGPVARAVMAGEPVP